MTSVDTGSAHGRIVSFLTDDSVHLRGTYWSPKEDGKIALLLLHDWQSNRESWVPWVQLFRIRGYGILTVDLRGHGESVRQDMRANELEPAETDLRSSHSYPTDVRAAIAFLARQPQTEAGRVAMMGVGLGSDLAYAASGRGWGTASTVLIGLDDGRARELAGTGPFAPRSIYMMYGEGDALSSVSAENFKRTALYPAEAYAYARTAATGMDLIALKTPEILARAIAWIEKTI